MTAGILPGQPPSLDERRQRTAELYVGGMSLRQIAARVGVTHSMVKKDLQRVGVKLRRPGNPTGATPARPHRAPRSRAAPRQQGVRQAAGRTPAPVFLPPGGVAVAFTAERGWHMTQAPPGWFLDLLAEVD